MAQEQASLANKPVTAEIDLLLVHGLLHLLGFDHADEIEHKEMFDLQQKILDEWGATS